MNKQPLKTLSLCLFFFCTQENRGVQPGRIRRQIRRNDPRLVRQDVLEPPKGMALKLPSVGIPKLLQQPLLGGGHIFRPLFDYLPLGLQIADSADELVEDLGQGVVAVIVGIAPLRLQQLV
jgi:hypothetical protein